MHASIAAVLFENPFLSSTPYWCGVSPYLALQLSSTYLQQHLKTVLFDIELEELSLRRDQILPLLPSDGIVRPCWVYKILILRVAWIMKWVAAITSSNQSYQPRSIRLSSRCALRQEHSIHLPFVSWSCSETVVHHFLYQLCRAPWNKPCGPTLESGARLQIPRA